MSDTPTPDPLTALDLLRSETQVHEPTCAWVTTDQYQNCDCGTWDRFDRLVDAAVAEVRAALASPVPEAERLDADRLSRALDRVFPQPPWIGVPISHSAEAIAKAYESEARP